MGQNCSNVSKKQADAIKKQVTSGLKKLGINTGELSYADIEAALNKLMTTKSYSLETLFDIAHKQEIINTIATARQKKEEENRALKKDTIGKAKVHIGERFKKTDPQNHPDALYVYTDNLQAYNAFTEKKVSVPGLIVPDSKQVITNVNSTSAQLRTNTNGDRYPNTIGFVTKKNAQGKDGTWLNNGQGVFEDNDEEFKAFVEINTEIAKTIKERLEAQGSTVADFYFPERMALDKAGLPKRFAEALQSIIYNQLGISSQVLQSKFGENLWGIEIQPFGQPASEEKQKSEKQKAAKKDAEEAAKSLKVERPTLSSDNLAISQNDINILARVFPNIEERIARVSFISTVFSQQISNLLEVITPQYENLIQGDHTAEDERVYNAITTGTEAERRKAFLEMVPINTENGTVSVANYIIDSIRNFMSTVISVVDALDNGSLSEDEATSLVFDQDNYVAREFSYEVEDKNWRGKVLKNKKIQRLRFLASQFKVMLDPQVFDALLKDAATDIEFNENLRIVIENNHAIISNSEEDNQNEENGEEGGADNRSGLNLIKYKLLNPAKTLSTRMKVMLSQLYKMKNGKYEYNSLGQRVRMNSSVAYYILLHHFSSMNRSEDFAGALDEAVEKYPWMAALADKLDADTDLRNEFYTTFRKIFVPYALIGSNGKIINLNATANRESFMQEATRLYEGHTPLSENSIYDIEGLCDTKNVAKVHRWLVVNKNTKKEDKIKKHPLAWVKSIIDKPNHKDYNAVNIIKALSILRGEEKNIPGIVDLLQAIGVPTETLDIDILVPYLDEEFKDRLTSEDPNIKAAAFNDLNEIITPTVRGNISKILQSAINITRETKGFSPGDHLLDKFRGAYNNIADALSISSEAFSQASFLGMENNTMFSYTMPDRISIIVGILSKAKTLEEVRLYLEKEWGMYDFFRDKKTGEWLNTWLEDLFDENSIIRQTLEYKNVLGFNSRKKGNSIQDAKDEVFEDGIITAMFSANDASEEIKMGWFRNPLFSDTDALVLLKMRRYSGKGYKDAILDGLVKVMRQEINRMVAVMNQSKDAPIIEFYNDARGNGRKFNYFPELNPRRAEILRTLAEIEEEYGASATAVKRYQDNYLKGILFDLIEGTVSEDGTRTGGLLNTFLSGFTEERGAKILRSIASLDADEEKTQDIIPYEDEQEEEDDALEGLTPEEREDIKKEKLSEKQREEVREKLTEFFYNDFFGQIQFIQLLGGDLAFYKNYDDFVKRCKENYAAGERMYSLDENGKRLTEKAMYMEDLEAVSTTWTNIRDLLDPNNPNLSDWEKSIYRGAVEMFKGITTTDGQSFRTLDSYKKLFKAYGGKWTPAMNNAFNNIKSGKFTAADFLALWNPIKPFVVTHESIQITDNDGTVRNEKVAAQHKNSEYLITALFDTLNTELNKSPQLRGLQRFMEKHNIDVVHFHSVVKHGYHDAFDINYDYRSFENDITNAAIATDNDVVIFNVGNEKVTINVKTEDFSDFSRKLEKLLTDDKITQKEYNEALNYYAFKSEEDVVDALEAQLLHQVDGEWVVNERMFKEFPLEDYMTVQPTEDHLIDHDALFGSQLRNIVPADLPSDFRTTIKVDGKDVVVDREQFVQYYNALIVDQLLDSFDSIDRRFNNDKELSAFLQEMMRGNPKYGDDVKEALSIDPNTGTFKVPLNSPNLRNKVEELLLSVFKNNIQRQKIKGGNVVLVSNFGLSDKLHVEYKKDGSIDYIPAYMPAYMRDMYEDYLIEKTDRDGSTYWTIDFDALKKNHPDEEILKIIGYRIPTEDKYSIMPIKIVGFMPVVAGTTIMLPADIISMSGTDFDIDKLFLMIKTTVRETYGRNLTDKFREWLSPELRRSLANTDPEQSKVIEKILNRKSGYTDEDVNRLADSSELFEQFMNEVGYEYQHEKPIYRVKRGTPVFNEDGSLNIDETSKLSNKNKRERHDIRNNMLIDAIWGVLTSKAGSRLSVTPGSYPGVKKGSRQQWILHNAGALKEFIKFAGGTKNVYSKLMEMSTKELEQFFEQYASPENPFTLNAYVKKHRNLMDGNALIGMFAVNSSNHYKLQFLSPGTTDANGKYIPSENILLNDNNTFLFTLPNRDPIKVVLVSPQKSPITGVSIGRTAAEFQAASPDNGKDPCLGDLDASIDTAYRVNFLIHMGFPPEIIGMLNTIDDFIDYGNSQETTSKEPFNGDISRIIELVVKFRTSDNNTLEDPIDREDAKRVAMWMNNIFQCAKTFKLISTVSRVDSPNGALPVKVAEAVQQMLKMEDFFEIAKSKDCEIIGLDRLINDALDINDFDSMEEFRRELFKAPIPRLQAAYTLGIKNARNLAGSQLVELRRPFISAVRLLRNQIKNTLLGGDGIKVLQRFFSEMTMFFLSSRGSLFASDTSGKSIMELRNYYIHDFPMKLRAFLDAKDSNGKYIHSDIRNLTLLQRITNGNHSGIKFNNIGKVSPLSRKHYTEAMDSLLYSPDPEVQKLAIDLLMYAYYDNGLNFGPSNYGIFFTTYFLSAIPGVMDVLRRVNGEAESSSSILENFVYQFILNHKELAYTPRRSNYQAIHSVGNNTIQVATKDADFLRAGIGSTGQFITFMNYNGNIYQRVIGDDASQSVVRYQRIEYNNTSIVGGKKNNKNYTPFYDATKSATEIEWSKLANRGAVSGIDSEEGKKKEESVNDKDIPKEEKDLPVDGRVPKDEELQEDKIAASVTAVSENVETTEDMDAFIIKDKIEELENKVAKLSIISDKLENAFKVPEEPKTPDLTEFKDTTDPDNKLCKTKIK